MKNGDKKMNAKLIDTIPNEDCFTIEDVADDLSLSTIRTRQIIDKAIKEKIVQKLIKKDGRRVLYAPMMINQLKKAMEDGKLGRFNTKKKVVSAVDKAALVVSVPVFDGEVVRLLKMQFGDEEGIKKHLQSHLLEMVKPKMSALRALEEEFEQKRIALLQSPNQSTMDL